MLRIEPKRHDLKGIIERIYNYPFQAMFPAHHFQAMGSPSHARARTRMYGLLATLARKWPS
jgi:hypothetical protein